MIASAFWALLGGAMIGVAAAAVLLLSGRICGISGIVAGLTRRWEAAGTWRVDFLGGLLTGGLLLHVLAPQALAGPDGRPTWIVLIAGALVGFGTAISGGCTSGHGVIGLARLSKRSMFAVATFMLVGVATATLARLLGSAGS